MSSDHEHSMGHGQENVVKGRYVEICGGKDEQEIGLNRTTDERDDECVDIVSNLPSLTVVIALVQSPSVLGDVAKNVERMERQCRTAAANGAKIIVLPETAITGYISDDLKTNWQIPGRPLHDSFPRSLDPSPYAETRDGPSVKHFAVVAAELGVYITVPYIEVEKGVFYNSVSLVGPTGCSVAHYRKNCPWPVPEKSWATPFDGLDGAMYQTEYGWVGLAICFDIHTILRKYQEEKDPIWALLYPIAWVGDVDRWFGELLPRKLQECACPHFICGANWATFAPPSWEGAGGSSVYGPKGEIIASAGASWREAIVYATLPTQGRMPRGPSLDLDAYSAWTQSQIGTDYWNDWNADDTDSVEVLPNVYSFLNDMRRMRARDSAQRRTPAQ